MKKKISYQLFMFFNYEWEKKLNNKKWTKNSCKKLICANCFSLLYFYVSFTFQVFVACEKKY